MRHYQLSPDIGTRSLDIARSTSISPGEHFDEFIAEQLSRGRYGSASEVVRKGFRVLEDTETKREHLRKLLIEGERSYAHSGYYY